MSQATPNIGLTCNLEVVVYGGGQWTERAAMVPLTYVQAVARAGARPLLIAPTPADESDPAELFGLLDGVLVTGGADVDPGAYGAAPHPQTIHVTAERDAFELLLVREAAARGIPCLGVCRGMQMVNVAYGGTLEQHLPERLGEDIHRAGGDGYAEHVVELAPGSLAAGAGGATRCTVKSAHHQGIGRLADGLRASGRAADGTIEALEDPARRFMLGVLWHPEEDAADRLIGAFVRACRDARAGGPTLGTAGAAGVGLSR